MTYKYLCKKCGTKKELEYPMGSAPKVMVCLCGGSMVQDFLGKLKSIQTDLPEDYKACSDYHSVDYDCDDDKMQAMLDGEIGL